MSPGKRGRHHRHLPRAIYMRAEHSEVTEDDNFAGGFAPSNASDDVGSVAEFGGEQVTRVRVGLW